MQLVNARALLGALLGITALSVVVLSYAYPQHAILILGAQAVILTTIYSVGNNYIEHKIRKEYEEIIDGINSQTQKLNDALYKARLRIAELERKGAKNG